MRIFIVALLMIVSLRESKQLDHANEQYVVVTSVPEPFENTELARRDRGAANASCFYLLGCFKVIPTLANPQDPLSLETEFRFYQDPNDERLVSFGSHKYCYSDAPATDCIELPYDLDRLSATNFNPEWRTLIIIGGYLTGHRVEWELRIKDLWLELEPKTNVILVSWAGGNHGLYTIAAENTRLVARQITVLLYYLVRLDKKSLDNYDAFTDNIYLVGHSLGAQIAGFVGQDFDGRLGRITGLDPAGPTFDDLPREFRLDRSDAQLVDALHTNGGATLITLPGYQRYGSDLSSSHVDLYANDGMHQASCAHMKDIKGCSHGKAIEYYLAILNHELAMRKLLKRDNYSLGRLRAYKSDTFENFSTGKSLVSRCPVTALSSDNYRAPDLEECSIAIDYVSRVDKVRSELERKQNLNFSRDYHPPEDERSDSRFYFMTNKHTDEQSEHYLLRVNLAKPNLDGRYESSFELQPKGCDFQLTVQTVRALTYQASFKNLVPIDSRKGSQMLIPFVSPDPNTKLLLASLDESNYYIDKILNTTDKTKDQFERKLAQEMSEILPSDIKLDGLGLGVLENLGIKLETKKGILKRTWGYLKGWWNRSSSDRQDVDQQRQLNKTIVDGRCLGAIEGITLISLRTLHRRFRATYSNLGKEDIEVLLLDSSLNQYNTGRPPTVTSLLEGSEKLFTEYPDLFDNHPEGVVIGPNLDLAETKPEEEIEPKKASTSGTITLVERPTKPPRTMDQTTKQTPSPSVETVQNLTSESEQAMNENDLSQLETESGSQSITKLKVINWFHIGLGLSISINVLVVAIILTRMYRFFSNSKMTDNDNVAPEQREVSDYMRLDRITNNGMQNA